MQYRAIYDLGARHFLAELADRVKELSQQQDRKLYLIAESDLNDVKLIRSKNAKWLWLRCTVER